ncbi:MAG: hypothetical protein WD995_10695 [Gemmatimonadota bacterium]
MHDLHPTPHRRQAMWSLVALALISTGCGPQDSIGSEARSDLVHVEGLGSLSFPNSGAAAAQDAFRRGVLLLHSFEYAPAAAAFREAQSADPDFALAYWGEAMTYNHPLWREKDHERAREALGRLAPTAAERRAKAGSEREAMYLDAVEALYAGGSKADEDLAYAEAMARLSEAFPDDQEARAFHSLAILGTADGSRDFATYMKAAATAQPVFDLNPDHPGAAHYIIHSFDDPVHAPLGLEAAREYSDIAPNAAHAQHMTTHIFVAMGMWEDVIAGNTRARDTQDGARAEDGLPPNYCGHYSSWLQYGHLQIDEDTEAGALMDLCHGSMAEAPSGGEQFYFASMRARQIVDTEDWALAGRWPAELEGNAAFFKDVTDAFAALRAGDPAPARALVASTSRPEPGFDRIMIDQLRGLLLIADGNAERGLSLVREAAEAEDALPFEFGPPRLVKPGFELLGEELLLQGRVAEAEAAFRRAVERTPGRELAVRGLGAARGSDNP